MTSDAIGVRVVDQARRDLDLDALPLPACGVRAPQAPAPHLRKPDEPACAAYFPLTRVTRIFQKSVLTKIASAGTGGTWLPASLLPTRGGRRAGVPNATLRCRQRAPPSIVARRAAMTSSRTPLMLRLSAMFVAFFVAPLIVLLALSLNADTATATWTAANYVKFFTDRFNYSILWDTLFLGVKATLVCLAFGYPIAWICARASARWQSVLVFLVILPILTSVVVRTFAWIVILGRQGVLNQAELAVGLAHEPLRLLYTEPGVIMVLAQVQMPLMVLPILTVLTKIDPNLADASRVLGAGEWRTLWRVTLPLSLPGVIAGCILTYSACVTAFVTQTLIGGARLIYMPLHIYQQAIGANNWPFASAISVIFMVAVLAAVALLSLIGRKSESYGGA